MVAVLIVIPERLAIGLYPRTDTRKVVQRKLATLAGVNMEWRGRGRELVGWLWRGALIGLVILGVGGRVLMRVIAHMEHRTQMVLTPGGTLTVIFAGTVAGLVSGLIYYLIRRYVPPPRVRTLLFVVIIELITWRGVSGLLPKPKLMFMTLALVHIVIVDLLGRRIPAVR